MPRRRSSGIEREESPTAPSFPWPGFESMFETKHFSDLTLAVGPPETKYKVHRVILARASPYFESNIRYDMVGLGIPNINPDVFKYVLEYIYSETLPEGMSMTEAAAVFKICCADIYVKGLKQSAGEMLEGMMSYKGFCMEPIDIEDVNMEMEWREYKKDLDTLGECFVEILKAMTVENRFGGQEAVVEGEAALKGIFRCLRKRGLLAKVLEMDNVKGYLKKNVQAAMSLLEYYSKDDPMVEEEEQQEGYDEGDEEDEEVEMDEEE